MTLTVSYWIDLIGYSNVYAKAEPITVFPIAVCPISYYLLPITVFPIAVFPGGPLPITVFPIAVFPGGLFPITYYRVSYCCVPWRAITYYVSYCCVSYFRYKLRIYL